MSDWKTISSDTVYETAWFKVRRDQVIDDQAKEITYSVVETQSPSVTIVAMNDKSELLLQQSYRYPLKKTLWEFPGGHSDGEDLLVAAKRELIEETGMASDHWEKLGEYYAAIGIANIPGSIYVARNVTKIAESHAAEEHITNQQFMDMQSIRKLVSDGLLVDAPALLALYYLDLHNQEA